MKELYLSKEDFLKSKYIKQVSHIWKESFSKDLENIEEKDVISDVDITPWTIIHLYLSPKGKKVYGVACYFIATDEALSEDIIESEKGIESLVQQGIKVGDAYLHNLAINSKKRRKGIALKMMESAENHLKEIHRDRIVLCVLGENRPAIALYNKLQYKVARAIPLGFLMEKNLA